MQKKRVFIILALALITFIILILPQIAPSTYESQPNVTEGKDTYIKESTATNYGNQDTIKIGKIVSGLDHRGLIEFNVSNISGNTIISGKMQVYVASSSGSSNLTIKAYRVTSPWTELETNWTSSNATALWSSSGGDYAEEINSVNFTNSSGIYYNFTITHLVRGWINGSYDNYGIILISTDASAGNFTDLASSDATEATQRPKIIIDYTANAVPTISNITINSSLTSPTQIGRNINFTINWTDLEGNSAQTFICNSSSINASGCQDKTFCNTSFEGSTLSSSSYVSSCAYTINLTDNRTTAFYVAVCDSGSNNCSSINQSYFYVNHVPNMTIIQPNGGETINQSQGNYLIKFNVSDADSDNLTASIYYSEIQNLTNYSIALNLNLSSYCTDPDSSTSTTNNCSYSWNSTGVYGTYYLTIVVNDSYTTSNDSSDSSFNVRSIIDNTPPNITGQWIDSDISSGEIINIYANISEPNINTVWVSINTTPQTNLTMRNLTAITYNVTWMAASVGNYQFKIYANDSIGNLNDSMSWQTFTIRKPNATSQNISSPATALPFSLIRITAELNASDPLRDVYAYLNVPDGFLFLSGYSQNASMGNFSANQTKNITWFVSVPLTEATYTLNISYTDYYLNSWNSSNFNIQVTSAVGGGYFLTLEGYPEVETGNNYFAKAYFTESGTYANADSAYISIYDSTGSLIVGPALMSNHSTGIYNYTYSVGSSANEGQWETRVNATKSSTSYSANQFWKVVGGPFDVRSIEIINSNINNLNISVLTENTGGANKDLTLTWNLTRTDNNALLDSGQDTFMVNANSQRTWYISPSTSYTGAVKIAFLGYYSGTEKAGAYRLFTTTSETQASQPATGGGGGGGGGAIEEKKPDFTIKAEKSINLTKNIEKTIFLEINNIGKKDLNNVSLELKGLNKEFYSISPLKINSIKQGKTQKFALKFLIKDYTGKIDFYYIVSSNELTKNESGEITILEIKDYFLREIGRLEERLNSIKNQTDDEKILNKLKTCENIIEILKLNVEKEEFINARDNIKSADDCIDKNRIKEITMPEIKMEYWSWIITWILLAILIAVLIFIGYMLYRKFGILSFLKEESKIPFTKRRAIKKEYIDKKIQKIEEKLK